jgi:integrase
MTTYRLSIINKHKVGFRDFIQQKYHVDEHQLVEKIKIQELDIYKVLSEFVIFLDKNGYKPKTIQVRLAATKGYLRHIGIKISTDDCKHSVRMPKPIRHRDEPITKEMILRLLRNVSPNMQTIILVLLSSGMRIGELVQLKISDIDFTSKPTRIRIRAETTKTREERETFITTEATNALKDYLTKRYSWNETRDNSHLKNTLFFGRSSALKTTPKQDIRAPESTLASNLLIRNLTNALARMPELDEKNANGRRVIHFHGLRKFFRTTVGNVCGRDFAEALIGHGFYMDTYYVLSESQKRELYLKAEPYLTISDFKSVEQNMEDLTAKCANLESQFEQLKQYLRLNSVPIPDFNKKIDF